MSERKRVIIGAGLYGLYAALFSAKKGCDVLVLEKERDAFCRATYINQARVHMGYHYPRSISTAMKSRNYFERFVDDYGFCVADDFLQIYATSAKFSWTDRKRFVKFCKDSNIPCESISAERYFKKGLCDGAYITREFAYDAMLLKEHMLEEIKKHPNIEIRYNEAVTGISRRGDMFVVSSAAGNEYETGFLLNATYAGCNEVIALAGYEPIKIKYELCEIILCETDESLAGVGITVMDGPFFSIMPFGKTGLHSLTSVTFTPHMTSYGVRPSFACQKRAGGCSPESLYNCDLCVERPKTSFAYMSSLARKYLLEHYAFRYKKSLFAIKPIMMSSEVDDSRPTVIRVHSEAPVFISVLSGKINTVYDLDEVL